WRTAAFTSQPLDSKRHRYLGIVTLAKIMANVYSAIDSISTKARMSRNWIPGRAPGLRPKPSHAAAVALACAYPQPADAIAMANPEVMAIHLMVSGVAPPPSVCPKTG